MAISVNQLFSDVYNKVQSVVIQTADWMGKNIRKIPVLKEIVLDPKVGAASKIVAANCACLLLAYRIANFLDDSSTFVENYEKKKYVRIGTTCVLGYVAGVIALNRYLTYPFTPLARCAFNVAGFAVGYLTINLVGGRQVGIED